MAERSRAVGLKGELGKMSSEKKSAKPITRREFIKYAGVATAGGSIASVLASCAPPSTPVPTAPPEATAKPTITPTVIVKKPVEIGWWMGDYETPEASKVIERFNQIHPEIKITIQAFPFLALYDKYSTGLLGQDPTLDLIDIGMDYIQNYITQGLLHPVDEIVDYVVDVDDIFSEVWRAGLEKMRPGGSVFGFPHRIDIVANVYRPDLFEEAGLDPDKPPQMWDEFVEACKALTHDGKYGYGMYGADKGQVLQMVSATCWSNGGQLLNEDETKCLLDQPEAIEAERWYTDLFLKHKVCPSSAPMDHVQSVQQLLFQGVVAQQWGGAYLYAGLEPAGLPNLPLTSGPIPKSKEFATAMWAAYQCVPRNITQEKLEAIAEFLKFYMQPEEMAIHTMAQPASKKAAENDKFTKDPRQKGFMDMLPYGRPSPGTPKWTECMQIIMVEHQNILSGSKTVEQAWKDATTQVDNVLAG